MTLHWVVLESGSNQSYVYATEKQRLQVAASARIWQLGYEWVDEAIASVGEQFPRRPLPARGEPFESNSVYHVVKASGKAMILAPHDAGHRIIEHVTAKALATNSNIDAWGVVGSTALDAELAGAAAALVEATMMLQQHRYARRSPLGRDQTLPFHLPCAYTGRPAVTVVSEIAGEPARARSATVQSLWSGSDDARQRMFGQLKLGVSASDSAWTAIRDATVGARELRETDGLSENGWVGVIYADGNGIGKIFTNLAATYAHDGREFVARQHQLSEELEKVAWRSLGLAIQDVIEQAGPRENWVLPIVVGGDDFVLAVDGRHAFDLAVHLMRRFAQEADRAGCFAEVLKDVKRIVGPHGVPDLLSLAVGLAFVKPTHPFSHAVELAEDLVAEVKDSTAVSRMVGGMDVLVLFESAVRDLDAIRGDLTLRIPVPGHPARETRLHRYGFPVVVPAPGEIDDDLPEQVRDRPLSALVELMTTIDKALSEGALTRGHLRLLREALTQPSDLSGVRARIYAARAQIGHTGGDAGLLERALPDGFDIGRHHHLPLLTALDLLDVSAGTARARSSAPLVEGARSA